MITPDTLIEDAQQLDGPERAAIITLALGEERAKPIWELLEDEDVKAVSAAIARLGSVTSTVVEQVLFEFATDIARASSVNGSYDTANRILKGILPEEKVSEIMAEIRHPSGRNMWEKLATVSEEALARFLSGEHPQTIAVIMSKLKPAHAARVLAQLPEDIASDAINRMLTLKPVKRQVIDQIEQTLRDEFMSTVTSARQRDSFETMADIFNSLDRTTEQRLMNALETRDEEAAERIKSLMFVFEDLTVLDNTAMQTLMGEIDKSKLALALKGASESIQNLFIGAMSERAAKLLKDDMEVMGPVRLRDVEEAQAGIVAAAKSLSDRGEISLASESDEDMVY